MKKAECWRIDAFELCVGKDSWKSFGQQEDPTSLSWRKSVLNIHWEDWCWSWNSITLATWWKEPTHLKRACFWERLKVVEGDDRMRLLMASQTRWTWVWIWSRRWWWTGKPDFLKSMGSQRVGHTQATELNWTEDEKNQKAQTFSYKIN